MRIESANEFPTLFSPITVGTMKLRNRVMLPPHASAIGNIFGTDEDAARNIAYFERRVTAGVSWVGSVSSHIANTLIPGFEPTGVGAATTGFFRLPFFVERIQRFCDALHRLGAAVTVQMVHQGGMPHGASPIMSAPTINLMPHVMDEDDIAAFVREYAASARLCQEARADGVELHLNHDDIHEWFLSPLTNRRTDRYGGSLANRARFAVEALTAIREVVGTTMTVGIRLNIREEAPGGYDVGGGVELARYFESTGLIDYVHGVVGSPWGNPSYIQPTYYDPAQWSALAGALKEAISLPVVHTGRINAPDVAERVLAAGHADVVGMARAHIADGDLLVKAREGRTADIRPCVGGNECISRRYVEGLPFGCAVNPHTSRELDGPWPTAPAPRRLLVVGGGPAGMELAALAREGGHEVELWEATESLGGQLRYATMAPRHENYRKYLDWQERRLASLGVAIRTRTAGHGRRRPCRRRRRRRGRHRRGSPYPRHPGRGRTARARRPRRARRPGHARRDGARGRAGRPRRAAVGRRPPRRARPRRHASSTPPTGRRRCSAGTSSAASSAGSTSAACACGSWRRSSASTPAASPSATCTRCGPRRSVGSTRSCWRAGACRTRALYDGLKGKVPELHVLGDAYAPRRLVFATRQAYALARELVALKT